MLYGAGIKWWIKLAYSFAYVDKIKKCPQNA